MRRTFSCKRKEENNTLPGNAYNVWKIICWFQMRLLIVYLLLLCGFPCWFKEKGQVRSPSIPFCLSEFTCFSLCWTLFADFVFLEGPDVDVVENSRLQTDQPVRGAVTSYRDVWTGALGRRVAQHVTLDFGLDSIPWQRDGVLRYFSGGQVGRSIKVWAGRGQIQFKKLNIIVNQI